MTSRRILRIVLTIAFAAILAAGAVNVSRIANGHSRLTITGYFANSNGIFRGDEVRILGVAVGSIDKIQPDPRGAKITFHIDDNYNVPADANAVILSPSLVSARAIQLTPVYRGGPHMTDGAVIPLERTAVPVEFDELREQLKRLADTLQPTEPGGVSTLGSFINTTADNLRDQGPDIRNTLIKASQAFSALGDHSNDLFSTVKNLSILTTALQDTHDTLRSLNTNLAAVTAMLSNRPNELGGAVNDINSVINDVRGFVADNRDTIGTTSDQLTQTSDTLAGSLTDIKKFLHVGPTGFQNFNNIFQPAQGTLAGALAAANFSNPIQFLCGAVQAASRLGAEQSAKLCVQYLAPIVKNRQYNFPPFGENVIVGPTARPNEVTYSEDWMRPDYIPPAAPAAAPPQSPPPVEPANTDPAAGLAGMMVPSGGGS